MPRFFQLLIVFSVSAFTELMAADLGQLQESFMARYDGANAKRDENLKKLETSYLGALARHLDKVKASGKLERVIPVRDEIEAVETGAEPLPELPENADRELKEFRDKYVEARTRVLKLHAETLTDLAGKMDEALEREEAELTKAGKIDEALAAKRMRETLAKDRGIVGARTVVGENVEASGPATEWTSLFTVKPDVVKEWLVPVTRLDKWSGDRNSWAVRLSKQFSVSPEKILVAHANSLVRFRLDKPVTKLRGKAILASGQGSVMFQIRVNGKSVFEKALDSRTDEDIDLKFDATDVIELETDSNGRNDYDWSAWVGLEVS